MSDRDEKQTPQTVYVVCQGMERGEAYMHDDMVVAVHSNKEAVKGVRPATAMEKGEPVLEPVYFETELDP